VRRGEGGREGGSRPDDRMSLSNIARDCRLGRIPSQIGLWNDWSFMNWKLIFIFGTK
jgi:hypothetical protein